MATLLVPSGYKRLARQVGGLWLDSSYQAQIQRLVGVETEWYQRVYSFLGTIRGGKLQARFARAHAYHSPDARLRNAIKVLEGLKRRGPPTYAKTASEHQEAQPPSWPGSRATERGALFEFLPRSVVEKLPEPVRKSIHQAADSYRMRMFEPCAMMLRKAIQNAIVLRYQAEGMGDQVLLPSGNALPFPKLIEKAQEARLLSSQQSRELMKVKWLGDTAAHSYANEILKGDVDGVLLIVRLALERIFTIEIRVLERK